MKQSEIFRYDDPRAILVNVFQEKKNRNPMFSLRSWSRKLGFKTPSYLSDVLNGKRKLKTEFALRVSSGLDLSPTERRYFEALVYFENAKTTEEKDFFLSVVESFRPATKRQSMAPDSFPELKHWYYGVIDEMTCLRDFEENYGHIANRLNPPITAQAAQLAVEDLLKVGLIERDRKGKLRRPKKWFIKEEEDHRNREHRPVRDYKRQFLELGAKALDEQTKSESLYRQSNIPLTVAQFNKLIELADNFFEEAYELEATQKAEDVFHVGVLAYRLTQPIGRKP